MLALLSSLSSCYICLLACAQERAGSLPENLSPRGCSNLESKVLLVADTDKVITVCSLNDHYCFGPTPRNDLRPSIRDYGGEEWCTCRLSKYCPLSGTKYGFYTGKKCRSQLLFGKMPPTRGTYFNFRPGASCLEISMLYLPA